MTTAEPDIAVAEAAAPRKTAKSAATRQRILTAATELFLEQGYAATQVSQITRRANVAVGTYYIYFPQKQDILEMLGDQWLNELTAVLGNAWQAALGSAQPGNLRAKGKLRPILLVLARNFLRNLEERKSSLQLLLGEAGLVPSHNLCEKSRSELRALLERMVRFVSGEAQGLLALGDTVDAPPSLTPEQASIVVGALQALWLTVGLRVVHAQADESDAVEVLARVTAGILQRYGVIKG